MTTLRIAFLLLTCAAPVAAQAGGERGDLSLGRGKEGWRVALSHALSGPRRLGFVEAGLLVRSTVYGGDPAEFRLRGDGSGLPTKLLIDPSIVGVNLGVRFEAPARSQLRVGMNLDILGLAIGPTRAVDSVDARPATFSLFRYGNADRGSLNSEFYVAAEVAQRVELRAGLSHYALGYRGKVAGGERGSYQRFDDAYFVAVRVRGR